MSRRNHLQGGPPTVERETQPFIRNFTKKAPPRGISTLPHYVHLHRIDAVGQDQIHIPQFVGLVLARSERDVVQLLEPQVCLVVIGGQRFLEPGNVVLGQLLRYPVHRRS